MILSSLGYKSGGPKVVFFKSLRLLSRFAYNLFILISDFLIVGTNRRGFHANSVLLVRTDGIGDFVLWLESAKEIRKRYPTPQYRLTLVANGLWASLATDMAIFDNIIGLDLKRLTWNPFYRWQVLKEIRDERFEIAIYSAYSRYFHKGDTLIHASGARERIGFSGDCSNILPFYKRVGDGRYTKLVPAEERPMNELERNAEFIRGLGVATFRLTIPKMPYRKDIIPVALQGLDYYVMFPGAGLPGKQWPIASFLEIAKRIFKKTGWLGIVCGGAADVAIAKAICEDESIKLENWTGRATLIEVAAILSHARLLVANDTGAVHIAASVGTPSVCILGGGITVGFYLSPPG